MSRDDFINSMRAMEDLGYSTYLESDHLVDQFGPLAAMAMAAGVTTRLRVGTFVLNNDLRHPAVLAQELATIDQLSGGRLEIGIGAGWNRPEYESAGIPFESPGTRIARMAETIAVLKGLFADGPLSFHGRFYQIEGFADLPRPVQRPHPPFMVGGGGEKTLALAAREAEIVGFAPKVLPSGKADVLGCTMEGTAKKVATVRAAANGRFEALELNTYPSLAPVQVTDSPGEPARAVAERVRKAYGIEVSERQVLDSPHVWMGSINQLTEKCEMLRERLGITYIFVGEEFKAFAPVVARLNGR